MEAPWEINGQTKCHTKCLEFRAKKILEVKVVLWIFMQVSHFAYSGPLLDFLKLVIELASRRRRCLDSYPLSKWKKGYLSSKKIF